MALNVLTVLFVGGASGAVQLLGCQDQDGEGAPLTTVQILTWGFTKLNRGPQYRPPK